MLLHMSSHMYNIYIYVCSYMYMMYFHLLMCVHMVEEPRLHERMKTLSLSDHFDPRRELS